MTYVFDGMFSFSKILLLPQQRQAEGNRVSLFLFSLFLSSIYIIGKYPQKVIFVSMDYLQLSDKT